MKVLVVGADGFVGSNVYRELKSDSSLQVVAAGRNEQVDIVVNLLDRASIKAMFEQASPDVVVNCAGVVANDESANLNVQFCENIFEEIVARPKPYPKVVITGSAAEYGVVEGDMPVRESSPLNGSSNYALSKMNEEKAALGYAEKYGINLIVARVFNPVGPGMGEKFLISSLLRQIQEIKQGNTDSITISRLDSRRDYIDIRDVARAYHALVLSSDTIPAIVNIGSGVSTTNGELIESLLSLVELDKKPTIIESQSEPEPNYAACADVTQLMKYGWRPGYELSRTMEDVVNG